MAFCEGGAQVKAGELLRGLCRSTSFDASSLSSSGYSAAALTSIGRYVSLSHRKIGESTRVSSGHSVYHCPEMSFRSSVSPNTNEKHPSRHLWTLHTPEAPCEMYLSTKSLVKLALPQPIRDQQGVHSPSGCRQVVSHSRVSILTTSFLSRALQFGLSGVPQPVECSGLQSGLHASNSSQRNTVRRRCDFPSKSHPLVYQAHLKTATLSENTSHRVNGIPASQWREVWIQFLHSAQFAGLKCFSSCTDETHQISKNSINSVGVGRGLMVSLSMLRYHKTQGGY